MDSLNRLPLLPAVGAACVFALAGCSSMKTPATAEVASSRTAVEAAASTGAPELAPAEMSAARDKMLRANQALAAKDYRTAQILAQEAQADATLAQNKASSAKATEAASKLQDDIRVLREELERANSSMTR